MSELELHPLLSERTRLMIMAAIAAAAEPMDFTTISKTLGLTRGNLTVHMRKLEEGGFVTVEKTFVARKPRTTYRCTSEGRRAVTAYLRSIEQLLKEIGEG